VHEHKTRPNQPVPKGVDSISIVPQQQQVNTFTTTTDSNQPVPKGVDSISIVPQQQQVNTFTTATANHGHFLCHLERRGVPGVRGRQQWTTAIHAH
jgi:hypothetical protein